MENILRAPGNRTIFMNKNSLYYNDHGKKSLNKKGFTGICVINTGNTITINNGKIVSIDIYTQLIEKYPEVLTFRIFRDVKNFIEKLNEEEIELYKGIRFNTTEEEVYTDENGKIYSSYFSLHFVNNPIIITDESYYNRILNNISFRDLILHTY